jgi:hypothetical protein
MVESSRLDVSSETTIGSLGYSLVYRAVGEAEFQQVMRTGMFEVVPISAEGKHFADTLEGARAHGEALYGPGQYHLIEADVPDDAPSLFRWTNLDGRGPARFLHIDDLKGIRPRVAGANFS